MAQTTLKTLETKLRIGQAVLVSFLRGNWGGQTLSARIKNWRLNWHFSHAVIAGALAGTGSKHIAWIITQPIDEVEQAAQAWLTDTLAMARTPEGIDTCMFSLKLVEKSEGRWHKLWSLESPGFARWQPEQARQQLSTALHTLPTTDFPAATHIELHLASLGNLVASYDQR